jgi:hypothetical protein
MGWIRGHSQLMNPFPCANADVGWIEFGALLNELLASFFRTLVFFTSLAFGGIYWIGCSYYGHLSVQLMVSAAGRRVGRHRICRAPAPR